VTRHPKSHRSPKLKTFRVAHFRPGPAPTVWRIEANPPVESGTSGAGACSACRACHKIDPMRTFNGRHALPVWPLTLALASGMASSAIGQAPARPVAQARHESISRGEDQASYGRVTGNAKAGFQFTPIGGEPAVPLELAGVVTFDGPGADSSSGYPPMRVLLGLDQQLSGRLGTVDDRSIRLEEGPGGSIVVIARGGAVALMQRPGEALVLQEGFEALDPARWSHVGEPEVVEQPKLAGSKS
jgi:hypothetical protein